MTILALYSNKGGVGKTAGAVNLSFLAARGGYHTLLVDLDPQSAATYYFRVKPKLKRESRGLPDGKALDASIKATDFDNLELLPGDFSHRNLDIAFAERKRRTRRLDIALRRLREEYDLIILDCPPTIDILAENIFNAADRLLVPLIPTTLSIRTFEQLRGFLFEQGPGAPGLLAYFSMVDGRRTMHREIMAALRERYDGILATAIPELSLIEQMGTHRQPVPAFAPRSAAARAYESLWDEVESGLQAGRLLP